MHLKGHLDETIKIDLGIFSKFSNLYIGTRLLILRYWYPDNVVFISFFEQRNTTFC